MNVGIIRVSVANHIKAFMLHLLKDQKGSIACWRSFNNFDVVTGELGKYRTTANPVTHITSSDIAEAGWADEMKGQGKSGDLMLINMRISLKPGHNKFTVEGKVKLSMLIQGESLVDLIHPLSIHFLFFPW